MKETLTKGFNSISLAAEKAVDGISSGFTLLKEKVNGLPIFISLERSSEFENEQPYDEKHYFVIPFKLSEHRFALHTMRCLPGSVTEINDLPKRRVFHFANLQAEVALKEHMLQSARDIVEENKGTKPNSLETLADEIDALDKKLTYGMLLVGGVAAVFNPLLGAGIAVKALLPGVATVVNKFGLRPGAEKWDKMKLEKEMRKAEDRISKEFKESATLRVVNPILQELDFALRTTEEEHDPLIDPNLADGSIPELSNERWRHLTETAICHVYKEVYEDQSQHELACLGPEDLRWLKVMFEANRD